MDVNGYWRGSQWVPGATVKTGGVQGTSGLALEVAAACARCNEGNSEPMTEIKRLLATYPVMKVDVRGEEEHLLAPLARRYAEWVLR